jgi:Putative beta-barrel porin 2
MCNRRCAGPVGVAGSMALMFLMWAPSLAAQSEPDLTAVPPIQAGPVSLYPTIVLRDVGIDSNVFNESMEPKDDFTFTVNPGLRASLGKGAVRLIGKSSAGFVYYQTYSDQQSTNGEFEGRIETTSLRLQPFASAGWLQTNDRIGYEIDVRATHARTSFMAGADFEMTAVTALTAWVRRNRQTYADGEQFMGVDLADQLDYTTDLAAAGAKFAVTPITTLTVAVELQRDRFHTSPMRDADTVRVAPALQFGVDAAITGHVSAGYRDFNPRDPQLPRYRGFVMSAGASYTLLGVTRFDVQANRDVMYSFDAAHPYYLASGGFLTVSQRIGGPFDVIGLGGRQRLRFQDLGGAELEGGVETTGTLGGGIGIRVGEHLRVTLTYDRTHRGSTESNGRDYTRSRVLSSVNYGL